MPQLTQRLNIGCVDTYKAFQLAVAGGATIADLVSDGIHPTAPAGVNVWLNEAWKQLARELRVSP